MEAKQEEYYEREVNCHACTGVGCPMCLGSGKMIETYNIPKLIDDNWNYKSENTKLKTLNAELIEALENLNKSLDNMWNAHGIVRPPDRFSKIIVKAQKESFKAIQKAKGGE